MKQIRVSRLFILLPLWVLSSCSRTTVEGGLSVTNGDFETGVLTPWTTFQKVQASIATEPVHAGKFSISESTGEGSIYQDVKQLQPGVSYVATAWVCGSSDATAAATIGIFDPDANAVTFSPKIPPKPSWQKIEHEFKVTQGTARIHLSRGEGNGVLYWDDLRILQKQ